MPEKKLPSNESSIKIRSINIGIIKDIGHKFHFKKEAIIGKSC